MTFRTWEATWFFCDFKSKMNGMGQSSPEEGERSLLMSEKASWKRNLSKKALRDNGWAFLDLAFYCISMKPHLISPEINYDLMNHLFTWNILFFFKDIAQSWYFSPFWLLVGFQTVLLRITNSKEASLFLQSIPLSKIPSHTHHHTHLQGIVYPSKPRWSTMSSLLPHYSFYSDGCN